MTDAEIEEMFKQIDTIFKEEDKRDYTNMPWDTRKDTCPKCGSEGEWIKMALVCRRHGPFLGHVK